MNVDGSLEYLGIGGEPREGGSAKLYEDGT